MTNPPSSLQTDDPSFDPESSGDWYAELDGIYKVVLEAAQHLGGQLDPVVGASTLASRAHQAASRLLVDEHPKSSDYDALVEVRDEIEAGLESQRAGLGGGRQMLDELDHRLGQLAELDPRVSIGGSAQGIVDI